MDETLLKRPIKPGTQYNKYFGTQCESSFLGNGNTDLSISIMAKWVNKYKHQCKSIALNEFANLSIPNTCNTIYEFLYNHIQYKLDGTDQKIRSPFCSWQDRENGIDCKSYSVFASCILSNLGIVHYLRKVKQPGYNPDSFSHVYVVVPENQKTKKLSDGYYIIDATIHDNYELPFVEKKDKLMSNVGLPHYGLGMAHTTGLGCDCNSPALAAPVSILPQSVELFKKFLIKLEQRGVSRAQTQAALSRLEAAINQGRDPQLKELFNVQNGLGVGLLPFIGLGAGDTQENNDPNNTEEENQWLNDVLDNIENEGWFEDTFGAVFGNGWNFSCWGSSYNPTQAKEVAQQKIGQLTQILTPSPTPDSFNRWQNSTAIYIGAALTSSRQGNLAACTRDGYKLEHDLIVEYKLKVINALEQSGYILNVVQQNAVPTHSQHQAWVNENAGNFKYTKFSLTIPAGGVNNVPIVVNTGTGTTTPINTGNNGSTGGSTLQKANTGLIAGLTILGLVVGNYFYKKRKKTV